MKTLTNEKWEAFPETASNPAGVIDSDSRTVCEVFGDGKETRRARARLIASAPQLLAALQRWEEYASDNGYTDEDCTFLAQTRLAIARATQEKGGE